MYVGSCISIGVDAPSFDIHVRSLSREVLLLQMKM